MSTFDDSDQSDPEQEGHDRGNVDTPTEPYKTLESPATTYRPQRDSVMSFMTTSTHTAVNPTTPYGPGDETGVRMRQDSVDSLIIVPGDVEAESGVVEEVSDHGLERHGENHDRTHDNETIEAVPLHSEAQDSSGDHDAASTLRPGSGGSSYEKNVFMHSGNESPGSQTPAGGKSSPRRQVATPTQADLDAQIPGPRKTKVIVKECEYATYYAVLYYVSEHVGGAQFISLNLAICDSFTPIP